MKKLGKKALKPDQVKEQIRQLIQQTLQEALEAELEEFLGYSKYERSDNDNCRNGYTSKTVKTDIGEIEIDTPRDRKGEFEPKLLPKRRDLPKKLCNQSKNFSSPNLTFKICLIS